MNKSEFLGLNLPSRDNTTDIADINAISDNFETIDGAFLDLVEKVIPELQTKENINLNFDDSSTSEEQYPSVPAVVKFTNRKVDPLKIINSASGNAISLKDSAKDKLVGLKLYGKTTQDGTPTPTEPKELKSVGDSGSYSVDVYGKNLIPYPYPYEKTPITKNGVTWTVNSDGTVTANGTATGNSVFVLHNYSMPLLKGNYTLSGIPNNGDRNSFMIQIANKEGLAQNNVSAGGDAFTLTQDSKTMVVQLVIFAGYIANNLVFKPQIEKGTQATPYEPYNKQSITLTDTLRGVGEVKDEIDFARGVKIQRFAEVDLGTFNWFLSSNGKQMASSDLMGIVLPPTSGQKEAFILCSAYQNDCTDNIWVSANDKRIGINPIGYVCVWDSNYTDATTFKNAMSGVMLCYPLAEPIETPLTESELNAYRQLMTNSGTTTILSEADMEVDYVADPKLYIDNKIAELTALTLEV